jgi:hypothetical protein
MEDNEELDFSSQLLCNNASPVWYFTIDKGNSSILCEFLELKNLTNIEICFCYTTCDQIWFMAHYFWCFMVSIFSNIFSSSTILWLIKCDIAVPPFIPWSATKIHCLINLINYGQIKDFSVNFLKKTKSFTINSCTCKSSTYSISLALF